MQQYDDSRGERRLLDIKLMNVEDAKDYYLQFHNDDKKREQKTKELEERIERNAVISEVFEWVLSIKLKTGKLIGKIEVLSVGNSTGFITIKIPNESSSLKYGVKVIDQFIEICRENNYFSKIQLEPNNEIVERYKKAYNKEENVIQVA